MWMESSFRATLLTAQATDRNDGPDHHAITEYVLARVRRQQVGHDTERRQRNDVYLGVTEEPEQVLPQDGVARAIRIEEGRADLLVEDQHDAAVGPRDRASAADDRRE